LEKEEGRRKTEGRKKSGSYRRKPMSRSQVLGSQWDQKGGFGFRLGKENFTLLKKKNRENKGKKKEGRGGEGGVPETVLQTGEEEHS